MFSTRKITYLATLTTASVAIIILLSSLTPIAIYPGIRIAFEGILIKLTGYLFGPIFGVITALITEFLLILFKPGIVHWSYTVIVILYGVFGGISYLIRNKCQNPVRASVFVLSISLIITIIGAFIIGRFSKGTISFLFWDAIPYSAVTWYFIAFAMLVLIFLYLGYLYTMSSKTWAFWFLNSVPILLLCFLTELTSIFLSPVGDSHAITSGSSGGKGYQFWMFISLIQSPVRFVLNILIIYNGWKILHPLIRINEKPAFLIQKDTDNKISSLKNIKQVKHKSNPSKE